MLLMTTTEDHLKRGSIMAITERFNMACPMIHSLGSMRSAHAQWA